MAAFHSVKMSSRFLKRCSYNETMSFNRKRWPLMKKKNEIKIDRVFFPIEIKPQSPKAIYVKIVIIFCCTENTF